MSDRKKTGSEKRTDLRRELVLDAAIKLFAKIRVSHHHGPDDR